MGIKSTGFGLTAVAAVMTISVPAYAADFVGNFNVGGPRFRLTSGSTPTSPTITASFDNGYTTGTFEDTYNFTIPQTGVGSGNLSTSFSGPSTMLTITNIMINGVSYGQPTSTGSGQFFTVNGLPITSGVANTLKVFGTVSGSRGTYSGNLTFQTSAIPEPATWLTMIVGFGLVGATARYRRRRAKVTFA